MRSAGANLMKFLLFSLSTLICTGLQASTAKLTQSVDLPLVVDGKTVGSMKLPAGSDVEVVSVSGTNAVIRRGDSTFTIPAISIGRLPEITSAAPTTSIPSTAPVKEIAVVQSTPTPARLLKTNDPLLSQVNGRTNRFEKIYKVTWNLNPSRGRKMNGKYYIPLPSRNLPYQDVQYEITNCLIKEVVDSQMNTILFCIPNNSSSLKITSTITVKNNNYKSDLSTYKDSFDYPSEVLPYLNSTDRINPNSPAVLDVARQVKGNNNIETVNNMLSWIKKNITYKREGFTSVDEILHRRFAECGGHAALFSALCRANKIPAREVWGVVEADTSYTPAGHLKGHLWSEIYLSGIGWIPVEPQILGSIGTLPRSYIRMYSYEPNMHISGNYNEAYNMVIMGGDRPEFSN